MNLKFLNSTFFLTAISSQASLVITGVIDGDLTGGNPKAVIVTATADIADLSIYGIGSANNGGGSDGEEFTFDAIPATTGEVFVLAGNSDSVTFFDTHYLGLTVLSNSAANINGDDAIELFESGAVIDTFGVIDVDGTGQTWEYSDGYAVRTSGTAGAFDEANYNISDDGLDSLDESAHVPAIQSAFNFTPVPEPGVTLLGGVALLSLLRRRR